MQNRRFPLKKNRTVSGQIKRPFWLPASNYYVLAAAFAFASFFLLWGIFHDVDEPTPWIPAGIGGCFILIGAVFLREIILKKARARLMQVQQRLDYNLDSAQIRNFSSNVQKILTLEKNAEIVGFIKKKSEAAKILMNLSEGHYEVFKICHEYLNLNRSELPTVNPGSPRLAALRKGREFAREQHKFHLLKWAEIESRRFTQEAQNRVKMSEKVEFAQKAQQIINSALEYYPEENSLLESQKAIGFLISSIRIGHWIEQAERAVNKANYQRAVNHYKDALYFMARETDTIAETEKLAEEINKKIEGLKRKISKRKIQTHTTQKND